MIATGVLWFALLFGLAEASEATRKADAREIVALVSAISGSASVDGTARTQLKLFDWVRSGATVRVPRESQLTLVLSNGHRFELTGPARTTVSASGLSATTGGVRTLSALPRLPRVAPISERGKDAQHSAAVRVRGPRITNLYPSNGAVMPVASGVFTFDAVDGATQYAIEVEDASGRQLFQVQTSETRVAVPTTLVPRAAYYWRVRTVGSPGAQARGEAEFRTLAAHDEEARLAFRDALGHDAGPRDLAMLAHIDYELGLYREARAGVQSALEKSFDDPVLRAALQRLSQRLSTR